MVWPHCLVLFSVLQVTLESNKLQLAFRQATELLHLHRCRGQTAELVPVLLLLGELHQHADSPVAALPHVLSCLSLCDAFSMELYRGASADVCLAVGGVMDETRTRQELTLLCAVVVCAVAAAVVSFSGYAVVMLAEIQLRLGAAAAGLELLHESLPLLLEHAPSALQAHALLVLGKGRLALAGHATREEDAQSRVAAAAEAMEQSLAIFRRIEAYR